MKKSFKTQPLSFTWKTCWNELMLIRRQQYFLMERMRTLEPGNVTVSVNVKRVAAIAIACASEIVQVRQDEVRSRNRHANVAWARHIAIFVTRELTGATLSEIQRQFRLFDHMTVKYACVRVRNEPEVRYKIQVDEVMSRVRAALTTDPLEMPATRPQKKQPLRKLKYPIANGARSFRRHHAK